MKRAVRTLAVLLGVLGGLSACATWPEGPGAGAHPSRLAPVPAAGWGDPAARPGEASEGEEYAPIEEYDPWEAFNEPMFRFNRQVDRTVLKPAATVWDRIFTQDVQRGFQNAFANLGMPRRFVNNLLQLKVDRAAGELGRFLLNSTVGLVGLFDVARTLGLEPHDEDTGQTMGFYGVGPGPYLILPFLPPSTLRDTLGFAVDTVLDPVNLFLSFGTVAGMRAGKIVNERSLNLGVFEALERDVFDLYSATRNAVLQRRQQLIRE